MLTETDTDLLGDHGCSVYNHQFQQVKLVFKYFNIKEKHVQASLCSCSHILHFFFLYSFIPLN